MAKPAVTTFPCKDNKAVPSSLILAPSTEFPGKPAPAPLPMQDITIRFLLMLRHMESPPPRWPSVLCPLSFSELSLGCIPLSVPLSHPIHWDSFGWVGLPEPPFPSLEGSRALIDKFGPVGHAENDGVGRRADAWRGFSGAMPKSACRCAGRCCHPAGAGIEGTPPTPCCVIFFSSPHPWIVVHCLPNLTDLF